MEKAKRRNGPTLREYPSDVENPLKSSNWDDNGYWEGVSHVLKGKKYKNIIFDEGVLQHLPSSHLKDLVNFLENVIYASLPFELYLDLSTLSKKSVVSPKILFLRELYQKFTRIDQLYLPFSNYYILYDQWVLDSYSSSLEES